MEHVCSRTQYIHYARRISEPSLLVSGVVTLLPPIIYLNTQARARSKVRTKQTKFSRALTGTSNAGWYEERTRKQQYQAKHTVELCKDGGAHLVHTVY